MSKTVTINQDKLLMLKETVASDSNITSHNDYCSELTEAAPEVDEYEIGAESDNPPVGGNGYHINEIIAPLEFINVAKKLRPNKFSNWCVIDTRDIYIAPRYFEKKSYAVEYKKWLGKSGIIVNLDRLNESKSFDSSEIGAVNYSWDFDEDEYQEWLQEAEYENTQESLMEYINYNVTFELEYLDNETYHTCDTDYVDYNELEDMFGSKMQNEILTTCMNDGSGSFETVNLYSDDDVDINDQNSVNDMAMRLLRHGDYFKDCKGFILTNGVVVYTESEHNEICRIPNINNKIDFIRMGNIRVLPQSIDIGAAPTSEQRDVLRRVITSYADEELYLDIYQGKSSIGAKYIQPDWRYVMGEIDRFFSEGIRPQGNEFYEEKQSINKLTENFDFEVDSSEIDLSSFKKKHELVPNIWNPDGKLNSRIRLKLLDIADDFWEYVNLTWVKPSGIILTGSICNFNWSQYSDIDLHLIVDFDEIDEKTEFVKDYLDSKKNEWNNEHSGLQIMGYPVELYVQNLGEMLESNGVYDLEENDWIKEPNPDDIKSIGLNKFSIKEKAAKIMTIIDDMYDAIAFTDDSHKIEQMGDDASYLWKKVKEMRKKGLETEGESSPQNIVYKVLRRTGYLDRLFKLSNIVYDKSNSITESKNIIKEYLEKDNNLPLYKYFKWASTASSCEKARDLAYSCSYYINEYIRKIYYRYSEFENLLNDGEFDYEDESLVKMFLNMLEDNNLCDHFVSEMQNIVDYYELPSWCTMDFNRIVKNEWCIHFGSDSESIAKEGFTGGTPEIEHLAYTNAGAQKTSAGYDFAFLINDRSVDYNGYGDEAVIFRTSGVEIYHYGDNQNQVVFWGPNVKSFIPIHQDNGDWVVYGQNGQVLVRCGRPSEIAIWATENLPQYRKQIMTGKNGYTPKQWVYDKEQGRSKPIPYPIYRNESVKKYITLLKENLINEEVVADGNSEHNPYKKRWEAERKALKDFICNFGKVMTSKENGKTYKVYYDKTLSQLIGYNYCICLQWDAVTLKPKSVLYIRALDKFTDKMFQANFDARGRDNMSGTYDDLSYQAQ